MSMTMPDVWLDEAGPDGPRQEVARLRAAIGLLLADGSVRAAYALADRLCRITPPAPTDLLTRCLVGLGLNSLDSAIRDLDASRAADGFDLTIARVSLAATRQADQRADAARTIVLHPQATDREVWAATALLVAADPHGPVVRACRRHNRIAGSVAWGAAGPPLLTWTSETESGTLDLRSPPSNETTLSHGLFSFPIGDEETVAIEARIDTHVSTLTLHPQSPPPFDPDLGKPDASGGLTVILPVHGDADATQACFASLLRQPGRFDLIVVDDHSPDPRVAGAAAEFCRTTGARHIVNRINLGFAGSVNKALLRAGRGDVLLLNADVVLPDDGLERMCRAARSQPDIGTAMPLSNDSAGTSFPVRAVANPPLNQDRSAEVDRIAARLHGGQTVDLVTNIGFCLYIREPCLRAVGLLSPSYGRGYFEDVEFCLKAEERGFRNVALPGIYVTHAGSRSFTSSKPWLVIRNSAIVHTRFPDYRARLRAEHWADPLRHHRSTIEEQLPPSSPRHLAVRDGNEVQPSINPATDDKLDLLWFQAAGVVRLEVRSPAGEIPQSLGFVLDQDGARRARNYLGRIDVTGVTVTGIATLPGVVFDLVSSMRVPVTVSVISLACLACLQNKLAASLPVTWSLAAADKIALAALGALDQNSQGPRRVRLSPRLPRLPSLRPNLGVIAPRALPETDLLLRSLARPFVKAGTSRVVVFGRCIDDLALMRTGSVDVTGPVKQTEYGELFERYRIGAVFSPYRTAMFGFFDAVTANANMPRIYFDWSGGEFEAPDRDLVFDCTTSSDAVAAAFAALPAGDADVSTH